MKMIVSSLLLCVVLVGLVPERAGAQQSLDGVSIAYTHHKLGVPLISNPIGDIFRPGIRFSVGIPVVVNSPMKLSWRISGAISRQPAESPYGTVISLGLEIEPGVNLPGGFSIAGAAGFFYRHVFSNQANFRVTDGGVTVWRDWGRPHIGINLGVIPGYDLAALGLSTTIFARADMELIYAPSTGFGMLNILPATTLMAGASIRTGGIE